MLRFTAMKVSTTNALLGSSALFRLKVDGILGLTRVVRFSGHEELSSLYEFQIDVAGDDIDLGAMIGKKATLTIDGIEFPRFIHGILAEVQYSGQSRRYNLYRLTLVPPLWKLLHRTNSRVFQPGSTPEILKKVLKDAGIDAKDLRFALSATYGERNYCVQYRESDFAFVSRLMEEDGIFYFFEHDADKATPTLVLADHPGVHAPIHGNPVLWFDEGGRVRNDEHVTHMHFTEAIRPGKLSLRDFNFHTPDESMDVEVQADRDIDLEVYEYPGEFQDPSEGAPHFGKTMAKIRLESLQVAKRQGSGEGDCPRLTPGFIFTLAGHPRHGLNASYLLTRVVHSGSQPQSLDEDGQGAFHYSSDFTCIDKDVPFRPPRVTPRPVVRGVQSARVVGPASEEVYTDDQGRVKVQFHWDREGEFNEDSSSWVRVSQAWAGKGWGAMFIPRIGHEVLVDFIEGDPDRPIITGRVYHGKNTLPYPLPAEKTKSTIKSDSSIGGGGFNELRFEDRKGGEEVFLHAQKDLNEVVLNNNSRSVTADQTFSVGGNQTFTITKDRSVTVSEGDESLTVVEGKSTTTIKQDRSVTVELGDSSLTVDTGARKVEVEKSICETSRSANIDLTAHTSMALKAETASLTASAQSSVTVKSIDADLSISSKLAASLASLTSTLDLSGQEAVTLESKGATLGLNALGVATLHSDDAVEITAPLAVSINGGALVQATGGVVNVIATTEINLSVGASVISIKADGVTISGPKITSTAIGMHEISGALIKIN